MITAEEAARQSQINKPIYLEQIKQEGIDRIESLIKKAMIKGDEVIYIYEYFNDEILNEFKNRNFYTNYYCSYVNSTTTIAWGKEKERLELEDKQGDLMMSTPLNLICDKKDTYVKIVHSNPGVSHISRKQKQNNNIFKKVYNFIKNC